MVLQLKSISQLALRSLAVPALLGCPQIGSAAGTWSVISLPHAPGGVVSPVAAAVDAAGNLYIADLGPAGFDSGRIQKRDAQGNWSVLASIGDALSRQLYLAVDAAGNLYVADSFNGRIQKRDAQGNWSVIATSGPAIGQVTDPRGLAVDAAGNQYIADRGRLQERDARGNWSVIATAGSAPGQVLFPTDLAVGPADTLYVADYSGAANGSTRVQKRDAQGRWSVIATQSSDHGPVNKPYVFAALAAGAAGSLYVGDNNGRIQKRDAQGNWSVIATYGADLGQVFAVSGLAVDPEDNLYVADTQNDRIQKRDPQGSWWILASVASPPGQVYGPSALTVSPAGDLYVVDQDADPAGRVSSNGRIQMRDTGGNWSILATATTAATDLFLLDVSALAADAAGNLYVLDPGASVLGGIQGRSAQGGWSVIAMEGYAPGQVLDPTALAVDSAGSLYVAESYHDPTGQSYDRIQKRDVQGNWSILATAGDATGQVDYPTVLTVDAAGNLYVGDGGSNGARIQKRDAQGTWSADAGPAMSPRSLAADAAGNLYVAEWSVDSFLGLSFSQIEKRDAEGNWSVLASEGTGLGQVSSPSGLAVDAAGNLYVADSGNDRVLKYTPGL